MIRRHQQRFIVVFITLSALAAWLQFWVTGSLWDHLDQERIASAFFSILIASWLLSRSRWQGAFTIIKLSAPWLVLSFILFSGYVFRKELSGISQRLRAALVPHSGIESQPGSMHFVRSNDGHFHIHAQINGVGVLFLADTGASDITLDRQTAARIGIDIKKLNFIKTYHTANGVVRGAPIRLERFSVGSLNFSNLPASVNEGAMNQPLLGMRFFNRLQGFEVKDDLLTIRWQTP
ncbi:MAG: TIGR02281 family clan AA aspartic protease [Magnetococcales bacterium]|nr:TIGR02281 family clan AA aspartic protease [Magnetococcales bacterium]